MVQTSENSASAGAEENGTTEDISKPLRLEWIFSDETKAAVTAASSAIDGFVLRF